MLRPAKMNTPQDPSPKPKYIWPWFVLGFVILGILLAVFWVGLAAKKVAEQRETGAPPMTTTPPR